MSSQWLPSLIPQALLGRKESLVQHCSYMCGISLRFQLVEALVADFDLSELSSIHSFQPCNYHTRFSHPYGCVSILCHWEKLFWLLNIWWPRYQQLVRQQWSNTPEVQSMVEMLHIKLSPFWPADPEMWFVQVNAHFTTWCSYIPKGQVQLCDSLSHTQICHGSLGPHTERTPLWHPTRAVAASEQRKLQQLFTTEELGGGWMSTQLLHHIQQLLGDHPRVVPQGSFPPAFAHRCTHGTGLHTWHYLLGEVINLLRLQWPCPPSWLTWNNFGHKCLAYNS